MYKLKRYLFSFILLLFFVCFMQYNVKAADDLYDTANYTKKGDVVYFYKPDNWSEYTPNIYAWDNSKELSSYPGVSMTQIENNLYKYEFTSDLGFTKLIFSDGLDNTLKTKNLDFICSEYVYKDNLINYTKSGDIIYFSNIYGDNTNIYLYNSITGEYSAAWPGTRMENAGTLYRYVVDSSTPYDKIIFNNGYDQTETFNFEKSGTQYTSTSSLPRTYLVAGDTIYFEKPNSWNTDIYIYMWNSLNSNAVWNTTTMTNVSGNIYSYTLSDSDNITLEGFDNVIFNDGTNQTKDLSIVGKSTTFKTNINPISEGIDTGKYDGFWAYNQDKSSLSKLVKNTTIPTGDEIYYTEDSYKLYKEQFDLAGLLLNTKYVSASYFEYTSQYDKSLIGLQFAYDNLKLKISMLRDKINEMKDVDTSKYEQSLVDSFDNSILDAENVLDNPDTITITTIKDAINKMDLAYNNLLVDKSELDNLINKAKGIDTTLYTDESVTNLLNTLKDATDLFEDTNASHFNVQEQISKLNDAISKLVLKEEEINSSENVDNNLSNENNSQITNNSNPSTGDMLYVLIGFLLLSISICIITTIYLKKYKIDKNK